DALPPRLPRRQNPHMHMLEAMLAWQAVAPDSAFEAAARVSLDLCRDHIVVDGAIREYFTEAWAVDPKTGHIIEPGHLEEWAWLLRHAQGVGFDVGVEPEDLHRRAVAQGQTSLGMIREIGPSGVVLDGGRRLWAQTEAIRTGLAFGDANVCDLVDRLLATHLATDVQGLWADSYDVEGRSPEAAAPASSLYHLMTAFSELLRHHP
uniref:AGE family epimerase/isomerase n=1 Tax=Brevundimonas sp. TaxID=1871086 RepID=UPI0025C12411